MELCDDGSVKDVQCHEEVDRTIPLVMRKMRAWVYD